MEMQKGYYPVVFLQGYEAEEAMSILEKEGIFSLFVHLMQWFSGDFPEMNKEPSYGTSDDFVEYPEKDGYWILSYNEMLGYCGLEFCYEGIEETE